MHVVDQPHSPAALTHGIFIWYKFGFYPYRSQLCLATLMARGVNEKKLHSLGDYGYWGVKMYTQL